MELKGLKINFLGDSITEGHGTSGVDKRFTNLIADRYGVIANNYGIGGTRIAIQKVPSNPPRHDLYFIGRVDEMEADCDVVIVFGGTNDYGHGDAPFGSFTDRTEETFCGAVHVLCEKLINRYPESKIIFITPIHRADEEGTKIEHGGVIRNNLKRYVDAIKEITEYYSIPVLDLYATYGIQPRVPVMREKYVPDGLHPNDAGHVILAEKIVAFLKTM